MLDRIKEAFGGLGNKIRKKILGDNNETIDFVMDSFYKLSPDHRVLVTIGVSVFGLLIAGVILFAYFSQFNSLDTDLNRRFNALHELRDLNKEYLAVKGRSDRLINAVSSKSNSLSVKPFFEEKATKVGVELQGLKDVRVPIGAESPLAKHMQYVIVEARLPKVSIPRLLKFLTEIEKSNNYMSVENLLIRGRYGNKLYFDAQAKFRGYYVGSN